MPNNTEIDLQITTFKSWVLKAEKKLGDHVVSPTTPFLYEETEAQKKNFQARVRSKPDWLHTAYYFSPATCPISSGCAHGKTEILSTHTFPHACTHNLAVNIQCPCLCKGCLFIP